MLNTRIPTQMKYFDITADMQKVMILPKFVTKKGFFVSRLEIFNEHLSQAPR